MTKHFGLTLRYPHERSPASGYRKGRAGTLLRENGAERAFSCGDAVHFTDGDVYGLRNDTQATYFRHLAAGPFWDAYRDRQ